jgi:hypothetical protein
MAFGRPSLALFCSQRQGSMAQIDLKLPFHLDEGQRNGPNESSMIVYCNTTLCWGRAQLVELVSNEMFLSFNFSTIFLGCIRDVDDKCTRFKSLHLQFKILTSIVLNCFPLQKDTK